MPLIQSFTTSALSAGEAVSHGLATTPAMIHVMPITGLSNAQSVTISSNSTVTFPPTTWLYADPNASSFTLVGNPNAASVRVNVISWHSLVDASSSAW